MSRLGFDMVHDEAPAAGSRSRGALVVVVIGIVLVMVAGLVVLRVVFAPKDYSGEGSGSVAVVVTKGESLRQIAQSMQEADVVKTVDAFLAAADNDERSASIGPGTYTMRRQMSADAALALMFEPATRATGRVVVPEGLTVKETFDVIVGASAITRKALDAAVAKPDSYGLPDIAKGKPEGYLFPATYDVEQATTATAQLTAMTRRFDRAAKETGLLERAPDVGLTPAEVVTVASILEREVAPADYAKVARVISNRLAAGMKLQLDSTVAYALGVRDLKLTAAQLATDSPYNTYRVKGLPPGPVSNPGQAALEAALSPAPGDWLYFITTDPKAGTTKFTASYEEFLAFKREFLANTGG